MPEGWLAYCAPGRKIEAALALMIQGEQATEITESPVLAGSTDVILVNPAALEPPAFDEFKIDLKIPRIFGHV